MQEYKLTPTFFSQLRKRMFIVVVPLLGLAAFVGLWIGGQKNLSPSGILIGIPIFALALGLSFFSAIRRQQRLWASYRLIVGEHSLSRLQQGLPDITITKNELTKIIDAASGGLVVYAPDPDRKLIIPATLENYSELRSLLSQWHVIENLSQTKVKGLSFQPIASIAWVVLTIVALMTAMLATDPVLVVGVSTLLLIALLVGFVLIQRSIYMTKQVKQSSWFMILLMFTLGARIVFALTSR